MSYQIYPAIPALEQSDFSNHDAWSWAYEGALSPPYLRQSGYWGIVGEFIAQVFSYRYTSQTYRWYVGASTYEGTREFFESDFIIPSAIDFVNDIWSEEFPQYLRLHSARGSSHDYSCDHVSPEINGHYQYSPETWAGWMPIMGTYSLYPPYYPVVDPNYRNFRIEYAGISTDLHLHSWWIYVDADLDGLGWVFWRRPAPPIEIEHRGGLPMLPVICACAIIALPSLLGSLFVSAQTQPGRSPRRSRP